jgi:hypothetical protein
MKTIIKLILFCIWYFLITTIIIPVYYDLLTGKDYVNDSFDLLLKIAKKFN